MLIVSRNASFNPGGWFEEPEKSSVPLLNLKIRPRMTLYLDSDLDGSFLVDASISDLVGEPYYGAGNSSYHGKTDLDLQITINNSTRLLLNSTSVKVGTVDNEIGFSLSQLPASLEPYNITVRGSLRYDKGVSYRATTEVLRLPHKADGGSTTRLDNLYGGLSVLKRNETEWSLIFPYTYYGKISQVTTPLRMTHIRQCNGPCTGMQTSQHWMSSQRKATMSSILFLLVILETHHSHGTSLNHTWTVLTNWGSSSNTMSVGTTRT